MKTRYKVLLALAGILLLFVLFVQIGGNKKFDAPYPEITAGTDPEIIARGEYLVFGPAHCATCHVPMDKIMAVEEGLKIPLSGGWEVAIPPGTLRAPNLTPDPETGIGNRTDGELARTLRSGIGHDGRYIMPVMPYSQMSDADLTAIISYLRSQPAVKNPMKPTQYSFLGKALIAFGMLKPTPPAEQPPADVPRDAGTAYGRYMATAVANCMGCHTEMDLMSGQFTKPHFSGGFVFEPDAFSQGYGFVSPNLTPHPEYGIMTTWTAETFISRMRAGRVYKGSPMPWGALSRMDSTDSQAIFAFLQSLDPIDNKIEKIVYAPGEEMK
ncbi:MAG: cytochrome c [Saprospiraceae bacterium]|nr:cytochrome c [Saprospiraceae bacterium]